MRLCNDFQNIFATLTAKFMHIQDRVNARSGNIKMIIIVKVNVGELCKTAIYTLSMLSVVTASGLIASCGWNWSVRYQLPFPPKLNNSVHRVQINTKFYCKGN